MMSRLFRSMTWTQIASLVVPVFHNNEWRKFTFKVGCLPPEPFFLKWRNPVVESYVCEILRLEYSDGRDTITDYFATLGRAGQSIVTKDDHKWLQPVDTRLKVIDTGFKKHITKTADGDQCCFTSKCAI